MPSHPSKEERPRITITAERHDELVASETRLKELHGAGLKALELVGRTMLELARARQAGRRLAEMHKVKRADVETQWRAARDAFRPCEKTPKARACCVSQPLRVQWCGACCAAWDALHEAGESPTIEAGTLLGSVAGR